MAQVKKSKNFDANLDSTRIEKASKNNVFKLANKNLEISKSKLIPVASGNIQRSAKLKSLRSSFELSSINYSTTQWGRNKTDRYHWEGSNKTYRVPKSAIANRGKIIPAGRNANKGEWFRKGDKQARLGFDPTKGVIL